MMKKTETSIKDLFILEPDIYPDDRGFFFESFNHDVFNFLRSDFPPITFIQDNHSRSKLGTVRGLHIQDGLNPQCKLVRCISGSIFDVVVDLRKDSNTYGEIFSIELSAKNKLQLFIPEGFAHGFQALEDNSEIVYKVNRYWDRGSETTIRYDDPVLNINWPKPISNLSEKDLMGIFFNNYNPEL